MQYMKSDNGNINIIQLHLGMNYSYTLNKLISCVFMVHIWIMFTYLIIEFGVQLI
jgi:hypothetical protein